MRALKPRKRRSSRSLISTATRESLREWSTRATSRYYRPSLELLENRILLAVNVGAVRPDIGHPTELLHQLLDTQPLFGPRDVNPEIAFHFGNSATTPGGNGLNDIALAADWSGIGFDDVGTVRQVAGNLVWFLDADRDETDEYQFSFGVSGDIPLAGNFDGSGPDDIAVVRESGGVLQWYLKYANETGLSFPQDGSSLVSDAQFTFGFAGDIPIVGDFNGDGRADVAVVRNEAGSLRWYVAYASTGSASYPNDVGTSLVVDATYVFGLAGDIPVVGNWDGVGGDNLGVVREGVGVGGTSRWFLDTNFDSTPELTLDYGEAGDQYIVGRWADRYWDGGAATLVWSDAANWSGNTLPGPSESVVINIPGSSNTIVMNSAIEIASLVTTQRIQVSAGTITIQSGGRFDGGVEVVGGVLSSNGTLNLPAGTVSTWSGGQIGQIGTATDILMDGDWTMSGASSKTLDNATFNNRGIFRQVDGQLLVTNGSIFNNQVMGQYLLSGASINPAIAIPAGSFNNAGAFIDTMTGVRSITGNFNNSGSVSVAAGTLRFPLGVDYSGVFDVATGANIDYGFGALGVTFIQPTATFTGTGSHRFSGGTFVFNTNLTVPFLVLNSPTVNLQIGIGAQVLATEGGIWTGGSIAGGGSLRNDGVMTIDLSAPASISNTFINNGTVRHTSFSLGMTVDAPGRILNGGTWELDIINSGVTLAGTGQFTNDTLGILRKTRPSSVEIGTAVFSNRGTVEVDEGTLLFGGLVAEHVGTTLFSGSWIVDNGSLLNILSGLDITTIGPDAYVSTEGNKFPKIDNVNTIQGTLRVTSGGGFFTSGSVVNQGLIIIPMSSSFVLPVGETLTLDGGLGNGRLSLESGGNLFATAGTISVVAGGGIEGTGTISAFLVNVADGFVRPGTSPGIIFIDGDLTLGPNSVLEIELNGSGLAPGIDYDQIQVTGRIILDGYFSVEFIGNFDANEDYVIIQNLGGLPVVNTFFGYPQGAGFEIYGVEFEISYVGGAGDDVVLTSRQGVKFIENTNDAGPGSLRDAMDLANATPGFDVLYFNIATPGPYTIQPLSPLPIITDGLRLDGRQWPVLNDVPWVELDGQLAGPGTVGIHIGPGLGGSELIGLAVNRFGFHGVLIDSTANSLREMRIGTDLSGSIALGNAGNGIEILPNASANAVYFSVISGNDDSGILTYSDFNRFKGNKIGTNLAGDVAIGNGLRGVWVFGGQENVIGTDADGWNDAAEGNVISGNADLGVFLNANATNNTIAGNLIGTDGTGLFSLGNGSGGITLFGGAQGNLIGGVLPHTRNVISGNQDDGIVISGAGITPNRVQGNFIGVGADGWTSIGNEAGGIAISFSFGTIVGGDDADDGALDGIVSARNIIANNFQGISIASNSGDSVIRGNYIGTDATGTLARGNRSWGIYDMGAAGTQIGGNTLGAGNLISGNGDPLLGSLQGGGIQTYGYQSLIRGNIVGLNAAGTEILGAQPIGIDIHGQENIVGDTDTNSRNIVSGHAEVGIRITSSVSERNELRGNYIGTDITGTIAFGNSFGVLISGGASENLVGGSTPGDRNVISGNTRDGVFLRNTEGNILAGNWIGIGATGISPLGNGWSGVRLETGARDTRIGTDSDGVNDDTEANVISGNNNAGVWIEGAENTRIAGNFIGTNLSGALSIPNQYGVWVASGTGHTIGGSQASDTNVLAYNLVTGLRLTNGMANQGDYVNNLYYGNLLLGIDVGPDGVTLNDPGDLDGVLNYPVVASSSFEGNNLVIEGFAGAGQTLQVFVSAPSENGIGQGARLIATLTEGSIEDQDTGVGEYGPFLQGVEVSTGSVFANRFRFSIPVQDGVQHGTPLTLIALGSTSEFSPIFLAGEQLSRLAPMISFESNSVTLDAGERLEIFGEFYDPDSVTWTATVDYGDGTGIRPLNLNANKTFFLDHLYVEPGFYNVTVRIVDNSLVLGDASLPVLVENVAPAIAFSQFTYTNIVLEGETATLSGSFVDQGGTHTVDVDWGDGTVQTIPLNPGDRSFTLTHVYGENSSSIGTPTPINVYRVVVTVTDDFGAFDTTQVGVFLIEVVNVRPHSLDVTLNETNIVEGTEVVITSLSFVDPGILDRHTVTVDWGDGTRRTFSLPVGERIISGLSELRHVYKNNPMEGQGPYVVTIEIVDDSEPFRPTVWTRAVEVHNQPPSNLQLELSESTIIEGSTVLLSGTFFDPGLLDSHRVEIDWGDGSPKTLLSITPGIQAFSDITHRYRNNPKNASSFIIQVNVWDMDSPTQWLTNSVPIVVLNAPPLIEVASITTSSGGSPMFEGQTITVSGSFNDPSPVDRHSVVINWGDGSSPTLASVNVLTRTFTATHRYLDDSTAFTVTVTDEDGESTSIVLAQEVRNVAPSVSFVPAAHNNDPNFITLNASVVDAGVLDTFHYSWTAEPLVSGPSIIQIFNSSTGDSFTLDRSSYPNDLWRVNLVVTDDDGGIGTFESVLLVGTNGNDYLVVDDQTFVNTNTKSITVMGMEGIDILDGTGVLNPMHSLILDGGAGTDYLFGGMGDDVFFLRGGNDNANVPVSGGPAQIKYGGDDRYMLVPNSTLTVIDPEGDNILDFSLADFGNESGVTFDLSEILLDTATIQDVSPDLDPGVHFVRIQGTFRELVGSRYGDTLTAASDSTLFGVSGDNRFFINENTSNVSIYGGADDDILTLSGLGLSNLSFFGDNGSNELRNFGSITELTFIGGSDDDILVNGLGGFIDTLTFQGDGGSNELQNLGTITDLTFFGGADDDVLLNFFGGTVESLTFYGDGGANDLRNLGIISEVVFFGGADDDLLINFAGGTIDSLTFHGDGGFNELTNLGALTEVTFLGGADDDLLVNGLTGAIQSLTFRGDDGFNELRNFGTLTDFTFFGGADDDLLVNSLSGRIESLLFEGDNGSNELRNAGWITSVIYEGGADDDLLVNSQGAIIDTLTFRGDDGFNELGNLGTITHLSFLGGADNDLLINATTGVVASVLFNGDDGFNELQNFGWISELTYTGGSDDDLLINQVAATIGLLTFSGDDGSNQLQNFGVLTDLNYFGGADSDLLVNGLDAQIVSLSFFGDDGSNQLRNGGSIISLTYEGGADDDALVNATTGLLGRLIFNADDGSNSLRNLGSITELTYFGGADDDRLFNHSQASISELHFYGDSGFNQLYNAGEISALTFYGGADDDHLINFESSVVDSLSFYGDEGSNVLLNLSSQVASISYIGGSDVDVLWNEGSGLSIIEFSGGDSGVNHLYNFGNAISEIIFVGGADDDILISSGFSIGTISFSGDDGDDTLILRGTGNANEDSWILFDGGNGIDAFRNDAAKFDSITFYGGADDDVFVNNGIAIHELSFFGDGGNDLFANSGNFISELFFSGDDGNDRLLNDGNGIQSLVFFGGADDDRLINFGDGIASIRFEGGADDDEFFNAGSRIQNLVFIGDDGVDRLINIGSSIHTLTFHGGADDDILWNQKEGVLIENLIFYGDEGIDRLQNDAAGVLFIHFLGGADDDILRNSGSGIGEILFLGEDGNDLLLNFGEGVRKLTFYGGAGDDRLFQFTSGIGEIFFEGDDGSDVLVNLGNAEQVSFLGGSDDDILLNSGGRIGALVFYGDEGIDILVNNGTVSSLTFEGGADDDILQNNGPVHSLVFRGDDGNDTLINNFSITGNLTFEGGADNDTLINNASSVAEILFIGESGNNTARIHGRNIGDVTFLGGAGVDTMIWNAFGNSNATVTFLAGAGSDFLAHRGSVGTLIFEGGDGDDRVLILGDGNLILSGGDGNDYYQFGPNPTGSVTINELYSGPEDSSSDTLDFSTFIASAVHIDLRSTEVQRLSNDLILMLTDGLGIENLYGTQYSDTLWGNARNNILSAAEFTEMPSGPVASRRVQTQWVFLDFDTHTELGEHVYTPEQRESIREQVELAYRGPDKQIPWFDVRVTLSLQDIPTQYAETNDYVSIFFNSTPSFGRPGGLASEIDPGNFNLGGTAQVQINGMLGGIILANGDGYEHGNPEEDGASFVLKGMTGLAIRDDELGALKPPATSENFVILSVKVAAHELGHLLGLRHHDAFGPIGMGIHDPPGNGAFKPVYGGPAGGFETFDHLIGSPASIGSTRFDDLKGLYFGEREAIKLAYGFSDPQQTTRTVVDAGNHSFDQSLELELWTVEVPNTLQRGINQPKEFVVQLISVIGEIQLDSQTGRSRSDWYSFNGRAGDLINIDLFSNSIRRFATGSNGELLADDYIDSIIRVYDSNGVLVPYYGGVAVNDDLFEPTDSTLIDLILPADGTYFIEVDTFHRFGDPIADESNPDSPLNPENPRNILDLSEDILKRIRDSFNDTDVGSYQLILYRFSKANANSIPDQIKGFGGVDIIIGGPGTNYNLEFDLGEPLLVNQGDIWNLNITIHDPAASEWSGSTVDYGDGLGPIPLIVSESGTFELQYDYSSSGAFVVTVTIVNDIGRSRTENLDVFVLPSENPLSVSANLSLVEVLEGQLAINSGTWIASPNAALTASVGSVVLQVDGTWIWTMPASDGPWMETVTVTLIDGGYSASVNFDLSIENVAPALYWSGSTVVNQGIPFEGILTSIVDPGFKDIQRGTEESFTFSIDWGDGSPKFMNTADIISIGSLNSPTLAEVFGRHTYKIPGTYTIYVTVSDDDGGSETISQSIVVQRSNIILDPTLGGALNVSGNAAVSVPGAIFVNSNASNAIALSGNASLSASTIQVVGSYTMYGGSSSTPLPQLALHPVPDPIADLVIPPGTVNRGSINISDNRTATLQPGIYSGIKISGNARVIFAPGTYIIRQNGLQISGLAEVTGHGVTIVNTGSNYPNPGGESGEVLIASTGRVDLSSPNEGPLRGIVFVQPGEHTSTIQVFGSQISISGILYAPSAQVNLTSQLVSEISFIVGSLRLSGNAANVYQAKSEATSNLLGSGTSQMLMASDKKLEMATSQEIVNKQQVFPGPFDAAMKVFSERSTPSTPEDTLTKQESVEGKQSLVSIETSPPLGAVMQMADLLTSGNKPEATKNQKKDPINGALKFDPFVDSDWVDSLTASKYF